MMILQTHAKLAIVIAVFIKIIIIKIIIIIFIKIINIIIRVASVLNVHPIPYLGAFDCSDTTTRSHK